MKPVTLGLLLVVLGTALRAEDLPKPLVVVLIGPPASGKSTQAAFINKRYHLPVITADPLRKAAKTRAEVTQKVTAAIRASDPTKGFVLDGYPATHAEADSLAALTRDLKLPQPIFIQIDVADDLARQRSVKRGDKPAVFEQELRQYHTEMDMVRAYYPEADIWTIIGKREPPEVFETIITLIRSRMDR
jgi:adenylate kinase